MIDVTFSQSARAGIKIALENRRVYPVELCLSTGDISGEETGQARLALLKDLVKIYPADVQSAAEEMMDAARENIGEILRLAARGEAVRLWYSDSPDEICGFFHILGEISRLKAHGRVYALRLPDWIVRGNGTAVHLTGWGEADTDDFKAFAGTEEPLGEEIIRARAVKWKILKSDNSPLRAVLNGGLIGVPEDFYDPLIYTEIANLPDSFNEAVLIGRVLGKYQLAVSDALIAGRVEKMIEKGLLTPLSAPARHSPVYHKMVKKAQKGQNCL